MSGHIRSYMYRQIPYLASKDKYLGVKVETSKDHVALGAGLILASMGYFSFNFFIQVGTTRIYFSLFDVVDT